MTDAAATIRPVLKSQYHSALAMLRDAIERCPDEAWFDGSHVNACWQIAYHALFFTHLYLQPDEAAFQPWPRHQGDVQHPDGLAGPADAGSTLPLIPEPYARSLVLEYWDFCDRMVDRAVDALDLESPESGFGWYAVSKLEHQIINVRHVQHHAAQLADRVRASANDGVRWVGFRHPHAGG
jgi:hypothetical protein